MVIYFSKQDREIITLKEDKMDYSKLSAIGTEKETKKPVRVSDSGKGKRKPVNKVKDELEEELMGTESTEEAINAAIEALEDNDPKEVITALVEILAEQVDELVEVQDSQKKVIDTLRKRVRTARIKDEDEEGDEKLPTGFSQQMRDAMKAFLKTEKPRKGKVYDKDGDFGFLFEQEVPTRQAYSFVNEHLVLSEIGISERTFNILYNKYRNTGKKYIYVYIGVDYSVAAYDSLEEFKNGFESIHDSAKK